MNQALSPEQNQADSARKQNTQPVDAQSLQHLVQACQSLPDTLPAATRLSSLLAFLFHFHKHISWAGIYYIDEDKKAWLGSFQGKPACMEIAPEKGVIGACTSSDSIMRVDNVHTFAGHIACDPASCSELVIPLYQSLPDGTRRLKAVLDIDSDVFDFFAPEHVPSYQAIADCLQTCVFDFFS